MNTAQSLIQQQIEDAQRAAPAWADFIRTLQARYSASHHGDYLKWESALDNLPHDLPALHPWRKGPWQFGDTFIDTEWRSDWKWARVAPHINLDDHAVLDIGCGNGYFGWQMLQAGARLVVGVDPTLVFCMQHLAAVALNPPERPGRNFVLPARAEELPQGQLFDITLSMGVLYHRKDPLEHIEALTQFTRPGGTVVLETLIVEGQPSLIPEGRYARMRNVSVVPDVPQVCQWMEAAGMSNISVVDITTTTIQEQRSTEWMRFESLAQSLDPSNSSLTVEGHPAPVRAVFTGRVGSR